MKGPGGRFERQVLASCPPWAWARKVPDPPARPPACRCGGWYATLCPRCLVTAVIKRWTPGMHSGVLRQVLGEEVKATGHDHPSRFTRGNPWDIEIRWLAGDGGRRELILECKSTAEARLPFGAVDAWKAAEMEKAAAAGSFAGVLWECRAADPNACHYLPVGEWLRIERESPRKSLPLAVAAAYGVRVEVDGTRGRKHTYYNLADLLRRLAGEIVSSPAQQAALFP